MKKRLWALLPLVALSGSPFAADNATAGADALRLDSPVGGWNVSGLIDRSDEYAASYPTPPVDRGRQKNRKRIAGHVATSEAQAAVPTLIVNGNAMPLYTNPDGGFLRHYAFGKGSNSVEIRSGDGKDRRRVQFYEANADIPQARIRIICAWDDRGAEVDMHVITPDGQHAYWQQPVLQDGGGLDVDGVDGPGPENFSTAAPQHGVYHVYVNYWGNFTAAGYNFNADSNERAVITTQITLIFDENTPNERRETVMVPLRRVGDLTLVKSFVY